MTAYVEPDVFFTEVGQADALRRIAVRSRVGGGPGLFWLSGFKSDMRGTKAQALDAWAGERNRACVRFDYSGHGESGGTFVDGTIGRWLEESIKVFQAFCAGPQVVVGSSMGGWLALQLARELKHGTHISALRPDQTRAPSPPRQGGLEPNSVPPIEPPTIAALVLIAPAVDFTEALMWGQFPEAVKDKIMREGVWERPS